MTAKKGKRGTLDTFSLWYEKVPLKRVIKTIPKHSISFRDFIMLKFNKNRVRTEEKLEALWQETGLLWKQIETIQKQINKKKVTPKRKRG